MPPRRRRLTWLWILLGVLGGLAVIAIVAAVLFVRAVSGPVGAMNDYLADLRAGRLDAAYGQLCADERSNVGRLEFATSVAPFARGIDSYHVYGFDPFGSERSVSYSIDGAPEVDGDYSATMVHEDGEWRVCDFFEDSADPRLAAGTRGSSR